MTQSKEITKPPGKTHLSRKEASDFTGFSEATLAKWATLGRGPRFVKLGAGRCCRVRYAVQDLELFLSGKLNDDGSRNEAA